ncbi:MAG TPA: alkaline phosphatase family protein [Thermoanaerobaculia bacterium]|nr:alkaline phosphatase family protein [Thermoanaerobaculia bacterium]
MRRWSLPVILLTLLACHRANGPHVIFIGLDGADWQLLDRYMSEGTMPNLARIVSSSDKRTLLTQQPPLSPLVWTSMMTGVSPLEHHILDFTRFNPSTGEKEPITSDERHVPAIWNMLTEKGQRVDVIGMWATFPAEKVNGTIVTDREVAGDYVAQTEAVHRAALSAIHRDHPNLAVVYFQGTDVIGHLFASQRVSEDDVRKYFARVDQILGDYARENAQLVIASDHGFEWSRKITVSSTAVATAGKWHREEGILVVPRGAPSCPHVDGITPLLLELLGLPRDVSVYQRAWRQQRITSATPASSEAIANLKSLGYIGSNESTHAPANYHGTRTAASYDNEGLILRELGRNDDSIKAYDTALQIDPHSASAMWNLSDLLHRQHVDLARADKLLDDAIAIDPEPHWLAMRGRYRMEKHDCRNALADFQRAASEQNAVVYASIGAAELCLGDESAAKAAFEKSLAIDPNQPQLRAFMR